MNILFITNLPAPYKISFFEEISKTVDLTVAYERKKASNRDDKWKSNIKNKRFEEIYLNSKEIGEESSISFEIIKLLSRRRFDTVILNGFSSPTDIMAIIYMKLHKIKFGIMCDGMLHGNCSGLKKFIKKSLISSADYYLSSNNITSEVLQSLGAKVSDIYQYPFSSVLDNDIIDWPVDKEFYKEQIGCQGKKVILFVGQFIERKGLDILVKAFRKITTLTDNQKYHLVLVGGSVLPFPHSYDKDDITITGFKETKELEIYYRASDVFVLPTREDIWGLVVNEAMSFGVPVVTTDRCGAGMAMIEEGKNGYIVPVGDVQELATKIRITLCNSEAMTGAVLETAKGFTIEKMATRIYENICMHLHRKEIS